MKITNDALVFIRRCRHNFYVYYRVKRDVNVADDLITLIKKLDELKNIAEREIKIFYRIAR